MVFLRRGGSGAAGFVGDPLPRQPSNIAAGQLEALSRCHSYCYFFSGKRQGALVTPHFNYSFSQTGPESNLSEVAEGGKAGGTTNRGTDSSPADDDRSEDEFLTKL
ncbi:unnamed protein product [Heligmosomoides polygyrus]|uniref:Uncharacterized protein n=1 Tax=Heligmosomoides polygyrus TaxID=6339 RepID=A0A3P8AGM8_HELPZ|nr:unnamed protein product [Heligmosomoides polygyrus]